jgi:hypothetical protein
MESKWDRPKPIAKRAIQICLVGGLSHLDSLDYKPELEKFHGKTLQTQEKPDIFFGQMGLLRKSDWEFRPRGQSGLQISELFPNIAGQADRLTVFRSMVTESAATMVLPASPTRLPAVRSGLPVRENPAVVDAARTNAPFPAVV